MVTRRATELLAGVAALCACLATTALAGADAVADFYQGRTIQIVLGTGPGRTYDLYARLLASHMPQYIPGKPTMVVQ